MAIKLLNLKSMRLFTTSPKLKSNLGQLVFSLNLLALIVLVIGALILNEFSQGLIDTKKDSLTAQANLMGEVIAEVATEGDPAPSLEPIAAIVLSRFVPKEQHALLYDVHGHLLSDSFLTSETVDSHDLPPARKIGEPVQAFQKKINKKQLINSENELKEEIKQALGGTSVATVRLNEDGKKIVSVAIPVRRVKVVLGALVLESGGVDAIISKQRNALLPFVLIALLVNIGSSFLLNWVVSRPIQRLSRAADKVRLQKSRAIALPQLEKRGDEIGTLARSLRSMTDTLSQRMDAIDRFAADVSHEIKNPLTSIRSALETHALLKDEDKKSRLMNVINLDVRRIDRLITDISNASRLDAELSRVTAQPIDLVKLIEEVVSLYQQSDTPDHAKVVFENLMSEPSSYLMGLEGSLGQVLRNLIDNARSFSAKGSVVKITLMPTNDADHANLKHQAMITIDDQGPGIPEENLETIFERFYTSRPKGTSFGNNSGLGLSISRQIVQAHFGRISAINLKDETGRIIGARFCIWLPNVYHTQ